MVRFMVFIICIINICSKDTLLVENDDSSTHGKCEINETLHSVWAMEGNIHVSYIALL